jgi:hypothetical protein
VSCVRMGARAARRSSVWVEGSWVVLSVFTVLLGCGSFSWVRDRCGGGLGRQLRLRSPPEGGGAPHMCVYVCSGGGGVITCQGASSCHGWGVLFGATYQWLLAGPHHPQMSHSHAQLNTCPLPPLTPGGGGEGKLYTVGGGRRWIRIWRSHEGGGVARQQDPFTHVHVCFCMGGAAGSFLDDPLGGGWGGVG